ncbi:MAG TPA: hypothetical protein VFS21_20315 [Roseiflexaceae bacterium]|nr:hypothetical protein [Roseiflexaceae bacterium]
MRYQPSAGQLVLPLELDHPAPPVPTGQPPADVLDTPTAIVVSVSGGLDSDYAALWARQRWPDRQLILWHAYLPLMDWDQTLDHLRQLARVLGNCRLVVAQAVYALTGEQTPTGCNSTALRRCHIVQDGEAWFGPAQDDDPAAILTLLDFAQKARLGQPPTTKNRWCTAYFKVQLFNSWARERRAELGERALLLSGERWAESPNRAKLPAWEWRAAIALQPGHREWPEGWHLAWVRPGIEQRFHQVAGAVLDAGIAPHPGYAAQGETPETLRDPERDERGRARLSCRVCIYTGTKHIQHALAHRPEMMQSAVDAVRAYEQTTGYHWRSSGPLQLAEPPPARRIVLVACAKRKVEHAAPAAELYCSDWFRKARAYAEATGDAWFILSAAHGLVAPGELLEPYERTLLGASPEERQRWATRVRRQLLPVLEPADRITVLAGRAYREQLVPFLEGLGYQIASPLAGLGLGQQLAALGRLPQQVEVQP